MPSTSGMRSRRSRASASPSGANGWSVDPTYCFSKLPGVRLCRMRTNSMVGSFSFLYFSRMARPHWRRYTAWASWAS